jgi:hypothetical protein
MKFCSSSFHAQQIDSQGIKERALYTYFRESTYPLSIKGVLLSILMVQNKTLKRSFVDIFNKLYRLIKARQDDNIII